MMKRVLSILLSALLLAGLLPSVPAGAAAGGAWDGAVDVSWYDPGADEFYLSTPAQLAGLAALVNGMADPACPAFIGDKSLLKSIPVDDYMLVGAGGGNVADTVYTSEIDFAYKTVYLTADLDMGGVYNASAGTWSGPNWTPIGGKFPMLPGEVAGDCLTLDTRFNGVLDGQGHSIRNLYCDRYAAKGFPYSMAIGVVGFLGGLGGKSESGTAEFTDGWRPAVRNLSLASGSIRGRRMVGGIVGRVGHTSGGVLIENCANHAAVHSTDAKGVGGICGSGWGSGVIRCCYNAGAVSTTYASPAGGIVGSNQGMDVYYCYNTGVINTNGNGRGRAIGSHDSGVYIITDCLYLEGTGDDPGGDGYYMGTSTRISVSVTGMSAAELKSAAALSVLNASGDVFVPDSGGVNGGYPMLWFEAAGGNTGTLCRLTFQQPEGGSIRAAEGDSIAYGQTATLEYMADTGYTLEHFIVNGKAIRGSVFTVMGDAAVTASFKRLRTVSVTIPESRDYYVAVSREGYRPSESGMEYVYSDMLRSGDRLVEGNTLKVLTYGYSDAVPEDMDLEYIDAYMCTLPGTVKNADGTYTVTGEEDVDILVDRRTQKKSWLNLTDTSWYSAAAPKREYTLTTPEELAGLALLVNRDGVSFEGVTILLGGDISLENADGTVGTRYWAPIGANVDKSFRGVFDGQGHAVYHMEIDASGSYAALFGCCTGAVIRNVSVYGSIHGDAASSYAAGIASYVSGGRIEDCSNYAEIGASGTYAGGIAAMIRDGAVIEHCFNYGGVTAASGLGGIVGISDSGGDTVVESANFGKVASTGNSTSGTGGVVGRLAGTVERCVNYATVGGTDRFTGGIAGYTVGRNTSAVRDSANRGAVSSRNAQETAALGGVAGYAQYLILANAENTGAVTPSAGFISRNSGAVIGREGEVKTSGGSGTIPSYAAVAPRSFPSSEKSEYTVTFLADGAVVAKVDGRAGDMSVAAPTVPAKSGYVGYWEPYTLGSRDVTVRAVYRQRLVRGGDTVSAGGVYHIAWYSSGEIRIADGTAVTLDGSNGGAEGFDSLSIRVGRNASLTLADAVLGSENTMLSLDGGGTLTLAGENRLVSRADADGNAQPALRVSGDLRMDGDGSLYVSAGLHNAAVYVDAPGSTVTLAGGNISVYKDNLLGMTGGAFYANGAAVAVSGGTLRIHTVSDNVAALSAGTVTVSGGRLLLCAERCPAAVQGPLSATGGTIAAYGHSGNSAGTSAAYEGAAAIPGYSGSARFEALLPFGDVSVTDSFYDAVALCYEKGYFSGTSDVTFSPDMPMTRAMFVTVLHRLAGRPASGGGTAFSDLSQDWYRDAVAWAVERGITNGTSGATFSPNEPVTREQTAVFLYRYAEAAGDSARFRGGNGGEHGALSAWAANAVSWALDAGLFSGARGALAEPQDYAPRSLLATALANYAAGTGK